MFKLQSRSMDLSKKNPSNQNTLRTKISINCDPNPKKYNETTQNRLSRNPPIYYFRNVTNPYKYNIQSVDLKYSNGRSNEEIFSERVKEIINKESGGSITLDDILSKTKKDQYLPYGYPYFDYVNRHPSLMRSTNFLTSRRKFNMTNNKKNNSMGNGERKLCIRTSPYITNNKNGNDNYEGPINGPFYDVNYANEEQKNYEVENNRYGNNENENQMNVNENNTNEPINQNIENQNLNNNNNNNTEPIADNNINNNNNNTESIVDNNNNNNTEQILDNNNNNTTEPIVDNNVNNNNNTTEPITDNNINNNNTNEPKQDNNINNNNNINEQPIIENQNNNTEQNRPNDNMDNLYYDEDENDEYISQFNYNNNLQYKYNNYTSHHDPKKITRPLNLYPPLSEKDQIQYKYYESDPHILKDDEFFKKKTGEKNLFRTPRQLQDFENKLHMTGESKSSWIPRIPQRTTYNNLTSVRYNILSPGKKSIFKTQDEITGLKIRNRVKSISDFVDVNRIAAENLSELFTNSIKDKKWFNRTDQVATNQADLHNTYRERIPYPFS